MESIDIKKSKSKQLSSSTAVTMPRSSSSSKLDVSPINKGSKGAANAASVVTPSLKSSQTMKKSGSYSTLDTTDGSSALKK